MKKDSVVLLVLVILAAALFGFGSRLGMRIQRIMTGPAISLGSVPEIRTISQTVEAYGTTKTTETTLKGKQVPVFSRYPFNLKS